MLQKTLWKLLKEKEKKLSNRPIKGHYNCITRQTNRVRIRFYGFCYFLYSLFFMLSLCAFFRVPLNAMFVLGFESICRMQLEFFVYFQFDLFLVAVSIAIKNREKPRKTFLFCLECVSSTSVDWMRAIKITGAAMH